MRRKKLPAKASNKNSTSVLIEELHDAGLRATPPRLAVLATILGATAPLTHAEVVQALHDNPWDEATLYRNLVALVEAGLLIRSDHGDHLWRYESPPEEIHQHPHFLCSDCGEVRCLPDAQVQVTSPSTLPRSTQVGQFEVELRGICDHCNTL